DLFGRAAVCRAGGRGDLLVQVPPRVHQLAPLLARGDREQRAGGVQAGAPDRFLDVHREVDDPLRGEQGAGAGVEDGAAAERQHAVVSSERPAHGVLLQGAEGVLAVLDEDVGGAAAPGGGDVVVGVPVAAGAALGQQPSHGGLAHANRADQDDQRAHRTASASREERTLRRVSVTLSPPNFSATASASTSATIASATIPAAGTAHTSERWWWAAAASPVATSTVRSARGTVAIGFIAARTRSSSPVLSPPSVPPERPVARLMPSSVARISSCAFEPGT